MAHFPDLTPYAYRHEAAALNVGWLAKDHPFDTGVTPPEVVQRLKLCCHEIGVNQTRGLHPCDFCEDPYAYRDDTDVGSAEIWAFGSAGTVYAAPTLIVHYIEAHDYLPPEGFINAVLQGPMPPDPTYKSRLDELGVNYTDWADLRARHPGAF